MADYTYNDIVSAYREAGVGKGRVIMLAPDLRWAGRFESPLKENLLDAHFAALAELIDLEQGTLVVSTPSMSLCNTDKPFDPQRTPSELGMLTEYVRCKPQSRRSFHPFTSYTAIGAQAAAICDNVARHSFGAETPIARMLQADALCVSVGLHPRMTCSEVHHCEMLMGTPYRYAKEFEHPVVRGGIIGRELFYMYVWYKQCEVLRNKNVKIFKHYHRQGHKVAEARLGRGKVYAYPMAALVQSTLSLLSEDIYAWLDRPPSFRPYRT